MGSSVAVSHWLRQRITAVLLVPLSLWFVFGVLPVVLSGAIPFHEWLQDPIHKALTLLWTYLLLGHGCLGMEVVIEDYVPSVKTRCLSLKGIKLISVGAAVLATFSILFPGAL